MSWWEDIDIVGGRDEIAGGTWLACSREGRVAFLTNVLELRSLPEAKSRGDLPVSFLKVIYFEFIIDSLKMFFLSFLNCSAIRY